MRKNSAQATMVRFRALVKPIRHLIRIAYRVFLDFLFLLALAFRSRRAVEAENLFLRKQLALFQERKTKPHRADDSREVKILMRLRGLGHSHMAAVFGIASRQEAEAYLEHPVLGQRLRECTHLVNLVEGRSIDQIFGYPDDLKFRSSMTLFSCINLHDHVFTDAWQKYFGGQPDRLTLERL
jgi:uncharacterized protein (DUF1810 family)